MRAILRAVFDTARILAAVQVDPEFGIQARFWTCRIAFAVGAERCVLEVADGKATAFAHGNGTARLRLSAPLESWREMMRPEPRPFFHDLMAAVAREGFTLEGDDLDGDFRPYYPAIRRLIELMRACAQEDHDGHVR